MGSLSLPILYAKINIYYRDEKLEDSIKAYKDLHGISRLKKDERESVIQYLEKNDSIFKRIKKMKDAINFGNCGDFKRD